MMTKFCIELRPVSLSVPLVSETLARDTMGAESRRLYVGNLFPEVTDEDIKKR